MNAMRFESLGAGRAIAAADRTAADLTEALEDILGSPQYREAAGSIAEEIAALPAAEHGATLMEQLARTGEPVVADTT
jgi:UDP:flavonoid glycosyltransferase YjiC (YdhE family)